MAETQRRRATKAEDVPAREGNPAQAESDPLLTEESTVVREDEEEVHDLGFIVEDHDDRRTGLLEHWQRLNTLDTDEALETNPTGALPDEVQALRRDGVPQEWYPLESFVESAEAESGEGEFADTNRLVVDPHAESLTTTATDDEESAADLDEDHRPETVNILGHAAGITTGFGTSVPQDIGAEGFSIGENPLVVAAGELEYPISTEKLSDEARGLRDVDEMGSEEELERLADRAARLEERRKGTPGR